MNKRSWYNKNNNNGVVYTHNALIIDLLRFNYNHKTDFLKLYFEHQLWELQQKAAARVMKVSHKLVRARKYEIAYMLCSHIYDFSDIKDMRTGLMKFDLHNVSLDKVKNAWKRKFTKFTLRELLRRRWDTEECNEEPRQMLGSSWWKCCGYSTPCAEAFRAGFEKGFTPYAMKHYKYLK